MGGSNWGGVILTDRDRQLLEELRALRVIDREQAKRIGPFQSTARANARLLALTRAGYLKRTLTGTISGGRKALYFLPGRALIIRRGPLAREEAFAHQLAVNAVHLAFTCASLPDAVSDARWRSFDTPLAPDLPLIPDGLVEVTTSTGTLSAFVEVDRGTETRRVWERKVSLYLDLAASGAYRNHLEAEHFRVLVVADSIRRRNELAAECARQTTKLFWLAAADEVDERGSPWGPVWIRPGGGDPHQLIPTPSSG